MTTDDRMTRALRDVANDTTSTSDDELWDAIQTEAATSSAGTGRWVRPMLVAASVAVVALVVGAVVARDDDGDSDSELNVVDDPTTTTVDDNTTTTTVDESTTTSSVPDEDGQDEAVVGPDSRPLVVVSDRGNRVTAYFSDGRDPIVYLPTEPVRHAEIGPDGTLWITTAGGCVECGLGPGSTLVNLDPTTGEPLETIDRAGFASVSPNGTQLAYAQVDPNAVIIRPLDGDGGGDYELLSHDPDGPVEENLWTLGQIQWSPDGSRMLVQEFWEDDSVWLVDLETHDYVRDGTNLAIRGADWIDDNHLLATQYCCYAEPGEEPRHLVEVDLSGDEPVIMDRAEGSSGMIGVTPGGLDAAVHVVPQNKSDEATGTGTLVRFPMGESIAENVVSVQW